MTGCAASGELDKLAKRTIAAKLCVRQQALALSPQTNRREAEEQHEARRRLWNSGQVEGVAERQPGRGHIVHQERTGPYQLVVSVAGQICGMTVFARARIEVKQLHKERPAILEPRAEHLVGDHVRPQLRRLVEILRRLDRNEDRLLHIRKDISENRYVLFLIRALQIQEMRIREVK